MAKSVRPKRVPAHLWEILKSERARNEPPKDAVTIKQYAAEFGVTHSVAQRAIERLVRSGVLEPLGQFGPKSEWHYGLGPKSEWHYGQPKGE